MSSALHAISLIRAGIGVRYRRKIHTPEGMVVEHIAGMRSSRTVVAIDINPDAPIHREADYSVIGDVYEIVPAMVSALTTARRTSGDRGDFAADAGSN